MGEKIFNVPTDHAIHQSGFTFIRAESSTFYSSIEKFEKAENIDIIYPTWLPDGVKIEQIVSCVINGKTSMNIIFNTKDIFYGIDIENVYGDPYSAENKEIYVQIYEKIFF